MSKRVTVCISRLPTEYPDGIEGVRTMNIILKNSLKNIFGKPFRTILVVFAVFVCSVCALLCFDLGSTIKNLMTSVYGDSSRIDLVLISQNNDLQDLPSEMPECDLLNVYPNNEIFHTDVEGEYGFVNETKLRIMGMDNEKAVDMGFLSEKMILGYKEIALTSRFAQKMGYKVGDTISVHNRAGDLVDLKVTAIITNIKNALMSGHTGIINLETNDLLSMNDRDKGLIFVDVLDDERIEEAEDLLKTKFPDITINRNALTEEDLASIDELTAFLYLAFAVAFLLVIFVTSSICIRIVGERMPFIGTLRSLGMSSGRTTRILLAENVFYGLMGSIPAVIFYILMRDPILNMIFVVDGAAEETQLSIPPVSFVLIAGVILGAVAVECIIPLRTVLKALKTPIRDIIFDSRDTEYKYNIKGLIAGAVLFAAALVAFFFRHQLAGATICMICLVVALALLFPWLLKVVSEGLKKIADNKNSATWSLALVETKTRKSTVGSGVLCATATCMCIIIMAIASSALESFNDIPYKADVLLFTSENAKQYSFVDNVEGVEDVENVYFTSMDVYVNDNDKTTYPTFVGYPEGGFKHYEIMNKKPDRISEGKVMVDELYASKTGLKPGDKVKITYNARGAFQLVREYTIEDLVKIRNYESKQGYFIMPEDEYISIFSNNPGVILVNCQESADPEMISAYIDRYTTDSYCDVYSFDSYKEELTSRNAGVTTVLTIIIAVAVGMTFIGMTSNQLIGFDGRRKECAILLSSAMDKKRLSGVLFKEVILMSVLSTGIGTAAGLFLSRVIAKAVENSDSIFMEIDFSPIRYLILFLVLVTVFTLTVLFPIRNLKKMKISEQLKYE